MDSPKPNDKAAKSKERAKAELIKMAREMQKTVGSDAFLLITVKMSLPFEAKWRATQPDHPGIRVIDHWRAQEARKAV